MYWLVYYIQLIGAGYWNMSRKGLWDGIIYYENDRLYNDDDCHSYASVKLYLKLLF